MLPPPSSSSCTCILLSTFLSPDLFSQYSLVDLFFRGLVVSCGLLSIVYWKNNSSNVEAVVASQHMNRPYAPTFRKGRGAKFSTPPLSLSPFPSLTLFHLNLASDLGERCKLPQRIRAESGRQTLNFGAFSNWNQRTFQKNHLHNDTFIIFWDNKIPVRGRGTWGVALTTFCPWRRLPPWSRRLWNRPRAIEDSAVSGSYCT